VGVAIQVANTVRFPKRNRREIAEAKVPTMVREPWKLAMIVFEPFLPINVQLAILLVRHPTG
jgi:hypothetical protein